MINENDKMASLIMNGRKKLKPLGIKPILLEKTALDHLVTLEKKQNSKKLLSLNLLNPNNNQNHLTLESAPVIKNNCNPDSPSNKVFSAMKILTFGQKCNFPNGNIEEAESDEDDFDKEVNLNKQNETKNTKNLLKNIKSENLRSFGLQGKTLALDDKASREKAKRNVKTIESQKNKKIRKEIFEKSKENRNFSNGNGERGFGKEIRDFENKKINMKNPLKEKSLNSKTEENEKVNLKNVVRILGKVEEIKKTDELDLNKNNAEKKGFNANNLKKDNLNNKKENRINSNYDNNNNNNSDDEDYISNIENINTSNFSNGLNNNKITKKVVGNYINNRNSSLNNNNNLNNSLNLGNPTNNPAAKNRADIIKEYNAKVSVRNSIANRNNLRPIKKPEENITKRTNDQFAKIGNYYVKSHNFNTSNNRSLTEEAERITSIESEIKESESLNNNINKTGNLKAGNGKKNLISDNFLIKKPKAVAERANRNIMLIDTKNMNNPQYVTDCVNDIMDHLKDSEHINAPIFNQMIKVQKEVHDSMRSLVIDWVIEVSTSFKLNDDSLYLAVNLFDRYLEKKPVKSGDLQLVAIGALCIACKYEEIYAPEIRDYKYISEYCYTTERILKMEYDILVTLDFEILHVSPLVFLRRFHLVSQGPFKSLYLAQFILESSLLEYKTIRFPSSVKAAACLFISRKLLQFRDVWPEELIICSGYTKENIEDCIASFYRIIKLIPTLTLCSTKKKYADKKYFEISKEYLSKFRNC